MLLAQPRGTWIALRQVSPVIPGLCAALLIAALARLGGAVTPLPPVFFALILGIAVSSLAVSDRLSAGITFASRNVLRFGIALLGAVISLADIRALGWATMGLALGALALTLAFGTLICRKLGQSRDAAIVSAAAVAICGASAAMAVAATLKPHTEESSDRDTARTIAGITLAGTAAMLLFPTIAILAGLSETATGVFLGASIHEVAQAAASGFAVSDHAGKVATIVKMLRVACLGLIVLGLSCAVHPKPGEVACKAPLVPPFLLAFCTLAILSSAGMVPTFAQAAVLSTSQWCLLVAIAALGMRTPIAAIVENGLRPLVAIGVNSVLLAVLVFAGVAFLLD